MDQYLYKGEFRSIPVLVFFDDDFNELGHWIERPARVREAMDRPRADLIATREFELGDTCSQCRILLLIFRKTSSIHLSPGRARRRQS